MRWRRAALVIVFATGLGCTGPMTRIAPQPIGNIPTTSATTGSACGVNLFAIIPIGVNDRAERAYKQALERAHATGLTDTEVTDRWYWIYIGQMVCTDISGTGFVGGGS